MEFKRRHGLYPSRTAYSTAEGYRTPARWLADVRALQSKQRLPLSSRQWLHATLPGWDDTRPRTQVVPLKWEQHVDTCKQHLQAHGKYPTKHTCAGMWLQSIRLRNNKGVLSAEHAEWMNSMLPGWHTNQHSRYVEYVDACKQHMQTHGRYPTYHSHAGRWLRDLRYLNNQNKLPAERIEWLNSVLPGWHTN